MQPDSGTAGALAPVKENHLAAITEPKALGTLLLPLAGMKVLSDQMRLAAGATSVRAP